MALHKMCIGELEPKDVLSAKLNPQVEYDFGVAPSDWLILWGVSTGMKSHFQNR